MRRPIARDINQRKRAVSSEVSSWANFTPASLPGTIGWWDASDISTFTFSSGTLVSQWNSKIGSYAFTQGTATRQPSRSGTVNGLSTVVFDGSNDWMSTSTTFDMTGGQEFSIWVVYSHLVNVGRVILEHSTDYNTVAGAWLFERQSNNRPILLKSLGTLNYSSFRPTNTITGPGVFVGTHNGALSTNETNGWVDLNNDGDRPFNNNSNANNVNATLYVGAALAGTAAFMNGQICEFGVSTNAFTQNQVATLTRYLRRKWATP